MSFEYIYERNLTNGKYDIPSINNINTSVVCFIDFTTAEPELILGNYYINTTTGISSVKGENVIANYLYEAGESNWIEHIPELNERIFDEDDSCAYFFNGSSWGVAIPGNLAKFVENNIPDKMFLLICRETECKFVFEEELSSEEQTILDGCVNTYKGYGV